LPEGTFIEISGVGHMVLDEAQVKALDAVRRFLVDV
jgi:hypothetical protein